VAEETGKMRASSYYHGPEKYNCAQAVFRAFMDRYGLTQDYIDLHKKSGGGRAGGGICGALFAVHHLIKDKNKISDADKIFSEKAGSIMCREIRGLNRLDCHSCVDLAADILNRLDQQEPVSADMMRR
jgi:hypothetical protein